MNWRRGLFRLWIAASILWVGAVGWSVYDRVERARAESSCATQRIANPALGNTSDCFSGDLTFDHLIPLSGLLSEYALIALGPVVGALVLGMAGIWVVTGFKKS